MTVKLKEADCFHGDTKTGCAIDYLKTQPNGTAGPTLIRNTRCVNYECNIVAEDVDKLS